MITEIFEKYMPKVASEESKELGDRSKYIGASDIGSCPRKTVLTKLHNPNYNTATLMRFKRGHLAENILADIFSKTKYNWQSQVEVSHPDKDYIKSHIDFLFHTSNMSKIGIVEMKTANNIPSEPYDSWVLQVQMQLGLLKLKYPKSDIKGSVFVIDLNAGKYQEFNGMTPDDSVFTALLTRADTLWDLINNKEEKELPTEESNLCAFCPFKSDCPNFSGDNPPETIKALVKQYKDISKKEKEIVSQKRNIQSDIINLVGNTYKSSFDGNKLIIKPTVSERVNAKDLKENYPDVYEDVKRESSYTYFRVM